MGFLAGAANLAGAIGGAVSNGIAASQPSKVAKEQRKAQEAQSENALIAQLLNPQQGGAGGILG